jgi:predicted Zn-dependent protease
MKKWMIGAVALSLTVGFAGASMVSAKKKAVPVGPPSISAKDKKIGSDAHPQLLAEFGGLYDAPQAAYVTKIGQRIAAQSGMSNAATDFTVSLLNSPVNNAFAIPGGYLYVTRQLMALMNNEAELASVLGHEAGHVAARHSKKRSSRATMGGLGTIAATVLGGLLGGGEGARLGQQLGGSIAQGMVLKFSRSQEYEADDLGIAYLFKAGYDTMAASTMLAALAQQTSLDMKRAGKSEKSLPEWASTHPDPASRVIRAQQKATVTGGIGREKAEVAFINALDGMLYDDDPKQGVVDGQTFRHPELKLTFTAPGGYAMNNGAQDVTMSGTGGQATFKEGAAYTGDMDAYIAAVFKTLGSSATSLNYGSVTKTSINGLPAGYASATTTTSGGAQVRVVIYGYQFSPTLAFSIVSISPLASADPFPSLYQSVRSLSTAEAAAVKPKRVRVVTVKSGDTVDSLSAKMAYSDYKAERFRVINGLAAGAGVKSGQRVKIIVSD